MTQTEALLAMKDGNKITHEYFTEDEYVHVGSDGQVVFEDGVKVPRSWWEKDYLQKGWSIYRTKN